MSREAVLDRVTGAFAGFFGTWVMNTGRRGRLFETLRDRGPLAPEELAAALGYEARYVETWCRGAYAFELLDETGGRFSLADGVAAIMLDPGDPSFMGGRAEFFPLLTPDFEMYPERMADGGLYPFEQRPDTVVQTMQAAARADAPNAIANVLPQAPGLVERLRAGGSILDAGCGAGYGLDSFAEAFPGAELVGIEIDGASLEQARALAAGRATVERVHVTEAPWQGRFDLVYANISLSHTWGSGPEVFAAFGRLVRPGGVLLCSDVPYPERLEDLRSPAGRLFTGVTVYVSLLGFSLLTPAELLGRIAAAGFEDVRLAEQPARTRMMALARRPG
jgi:2-polyprenyl-3-methyl-5-hydroxy-6-metoxy-1,4-benzoquinol methylase